MYELRTCALEPAKQPILDTYLSKALLATLKRLGIGAVGVFVEKARDEALNVYVLIVR